MTVALASLLAVTVCGLPSKPIEAWKPMLCESHRQVSVVDEELVARPEPRRPAILPTLYGTYAAFQVFDVWTTTRAVSVGARETNPTVAPFANNRVVLTSIKAATTTATIYFADRLWRRNRTSAVLVVAALNGVSAWVAIHNVRVAQRAEIRR